MKFDVHDLISNMKISF